MNMIYMNVEKAFQFFNSTFKKGRAKNLYPPLKNVEPDNNL